MTDYFIAPRQPGVRPADPPDYDGVTFVYVFTVVLDLWTQPPVQENVTIVVANAQGFVPGMTVAIENGGYYEVVSTTALDRMTVMNLGYSWNVPPGTVIFPGKITTTSLPGPPGEDGADGPPGPPLTPKGTVATTSNLPTTGNQVGDMYNVIADGHSYGWDGVAWVDLGPFGSPGQPGAPGAPGAPGTDGQPAYTFSSAGFTVPPIGSSVTVPVEDTSWTTLNEVVWVQNAGGPGVAGPMQVTGITTTSLTLLNIGTSTPSGTTAQMIFGETPSGAINGANTAYVTANLYSPNTLAVFLNGLRQARAGDYNETGNQSFSFLAAPLPGDTLCIDYVKS